MKFSNMFNDGGGYELPAFGLFFVLGGIGLYSVCSAGFGIGTDLSGAIGLGAGLVTGTIGALTTTGRRIAELAIIALHFER